MPYDLYPAVNEDLELAPEVRAANAKTAEFRNQVIPMTQTQRNNLTGDDLWDGRLVMNTTTSRIDRYDADEAAWITVTTDPPGVIKAYAGVSEPAFHVWADGSLVPRDGIYAGLFGQIGTAFNTGGESGSVFRLPNMQGRFVIGSDPAVPAYNALNDRGGEATHVLTTAEMPGHDHGGNTADASILHAHGTNVDDVVDHQHGLPISDQSVQSGTGATVQKWNGAGGQTSFAAGAQALSGSTNNADVVHHHGITSQGGGGAHNNLPPYITLNYLITL